jgi:hypothetical protein
MNNLTNNLTNKFDAIFGNETYRNSREAILADVRLLHNDNDRMQSLLASYPESSEYEIYRFFQFIVETQAVSIRKPNEVMESNIFEYAYERGNLCFKFGIRSVKDIIAKYLQWEEYMAAEMNDSTTFNFYVTRTEKAHVLKCGANWLCQNYI